MFRPFNDDDKSIKHVRLFPSAIVCSCGERFDSDCRVDCDSRALWLYLAHTTTAIATSPSCTSKPHRLQCTLFSCVLCARSVEIGHYRNHLAKCRTDGVRAAISKYRDNANRRSDDILPPSLECRKCLEDDQFLCLGIDTMLEHGHIGADPLSSSSMELYVTCRACSCRVPVDSAFGHAAFAHRERLVGETAVADMFVSAAPMRSIPVWAERNSDVCDGTDEMVGVAASSRFSDTALGLERPVKNRRSEFQAQVVAPVFRGKAPTVKRHVDVVGVRIAERESSVDSIRGAQSQPSFGFTTADVLAEETFSEEAVSALYDNDDVDGASRREEKFTASFASIDAGNRNEVALRARLPISNATGLPSGITGVSSQECGTKSKRRNKGGNAINCKLCRRCFTDWSQQELHMERSAACRRVARKPSECEECGKTFSERSNMRRHQRVHTGLLACCLCNKRFLHADALRDHRRTHSGERRYSCPDCDSRFSRKDSLVIHQRTHTGERPFPCTKCAKSFTQMGALYRHQRQVHRNIT